jgi:hypothetical protein
VTRATLATAAVLVAGALVFVAFARGKEGGAIAKAPVAKEDPAPAAPSASDSPEPAVAAQKAAITDDRADASDGGARDDASLMARLREVQDADPALAYELAKEGQRRFPESADAPERAALAVKALALQGKRFEARREAGDMVAKYPDSPWAREVEMHTGAHPRRSQTAP